MVLSAMTLLSLSRPESVLLAAHIGTDTNCCREEALQESGACTPLKVLGQYEGPSM